jgi:hypothetical protein
VRKIFLDSLLSSITHTVCGYKQSAMTRVPKFYWTDSSPSSSIEVVPRIAPSLNRVAMTGPSPRDAKFAARSRLPQLTDEMLHRIAVYVAGGLVAGCVILAAGHVGSEQHNWWGWLLIGAPLTWLSYIGVIALAFVALRGIVGALRWSLALTARMSVRARVGLPGCLVALAGAFIVLVGPGAVRNTMGTLAAVVLPCAIVIGVGGWLAVLTHHHWHNARRRWQRNAPYTLLALVAAAAILALGAHDTLAAQATVGLLFPVAVWLAVRMWRAMNASSLVAVRALDDIAVSVILGLPLVTLLVWLPDRLESRDIGLLADALHIPPAGVATARETLRLAGKYAELPQRWWIGLYALLAAASVLFAVRPGLLPAVMRRFSRLRIVPSVHTEHRVATGVHIGLLVTALIAAAAPTVVAPGLKTHLATRYTETLAENLRKHGELVAYTEFQNAFNARPTMTRVTPLYDMLTHIDKASRPAPDQPADAGTALSLARRMGELQAQTLSLSAPPAITQAAVAATQQAGFDTPLRDADNLSERIGKLDHEQADEHTTVEQVHQAGDLAAKAIAVAAQLPQFGNVEVVQVVREYLSGLVESPLKDVFAGWVGHVAGAQPPPSAAEIVIPDGPRLKKAAAAALNAQLVGIVITDPAALGKLQIESDDVVSAVDLTNAARHLQGQKGPCRDCPDRKPAPTPRRSLV